MKTVSNALLWSDSNPFSCGGRKRRSAGLLAGALLLGLLAATPALAEPGRKHEPQHRSHYQPPYRSEYAPRMQPGPRYSPPPVVRPVAPRHAGPPGYRFRAEDRSYLQAHYRDSLRSVRRDRRPHFAPGRVIPHAYRPHLSRLPHHLGYRLQPTPRGYHVGYYQGYSVVYDPLTFTILGVLDLLTR